MKKPTSRHPSLLVAEIAVILVCKLCAIFGLWYCFFGPDKRTEQTPEAVAALFFSHEMPSGPRPPKEIRDDFIRTR